MPGLGATAHDASKEKVEITAGKEITLKTGDSSIVMTKEGDITIKGKKIVIDGSSIKLE